MSSGELLRELGELATSLGPAVRLLSKHPHLRPYEVKTVLRAVAGNAVTPGSQP